MSRERFTTPKAKCMWACLQQPKTDPNGEYEDTFQIVLILDKDHKDLLNQISKLHKDAGGTQNIGEKGHPVKFHFKKHTDENGNEVRTKVPDIFEVQFKTKAEFADHIPTFDALKQAIIRDKNFIANDSVVRVNWSFNYYNRSGNKGVSLFLNGVQVIDLIPWDDPTAEDLGFAKEDGYVETTEFDKLEKKVEEHNEDDTEKSTMEEDDLPF